MKAIKNNLWIVLLMVNGVCASSHYLLQNEAKKEWMKKILQSTISCYKKKLLVVSEEECTMFDCLLKSDEALRFFPYLISNLRWDQEVSYVGHLTKKEVDTLVTLGKIFYEDDKPEHYNDKDRKYLKEAERKLAKEEREETADLYRKQQQANEDKEEQLKAAWRAWHKF